jgi:hypothetical protein
MNDRNMLEHVPETISIQFFDYRFEIIAKSRTLLVFGTSFQCFEEENEQARPDGFVLIFLAGICILRTMGRNRCFGLSWIFEIVQDTTRKNCQEDHSSLFHIIG